jgi:predicted metal-dependent hydrolase
MLFRRSPPVLRAPRPQPGEVVEVAGCPVRLRVNPRARRISLRLDPARREVVLTAPSLRRLPDALAFAESRRDWIIERLAELPAPLAFTPGALIEVAGRPCRLEQAAMRVRASYRPETAVEPARLIASGEGDAFARAVERGLRTEALARLSARTAVHCAALGEAAPEVRLQDARSRWGSCRKAGAERPASIRYNWRLILAPADVLDYVAAHECAHLLEANHGPRFWALVRRLHPASAPARAWLKTHGARLHAAGASDRQAGHRRSEAYHV